MVRGEEEEIWTARDGGGGGEASKGGVGLKREK